MVIMVPWGHFMQVLERRFETFFNKSETIVTCMFAAYSIGLCSLCMCNKAVAGTLFARVSGGHYPAPRHVPHSKK